MKILIHFTFFFSVLHFGLYAQPATINNNVRAANILTRMGSYRMTPGDMTFPITSSRTTQIIGDTYLDLHWAQSSLLLYTKDQLIEDYLTRYDIKNNEFEFRLQNGVRVLPGSKVKNMVWVDSLTKTPRYLINAQDYVNDGVPLAGFFEVLVEGDVPLLKKIYLEILKPNFSPALNVGSKDYKILKKVEYYYALEKNSYRIKKKSSLEELSAVYPDLDILMKKESISLNAEEDLKKLFTLLKDKNK